MSTSMQNRKHNRYSPEEKLGTHFAYDVTTRLCFQCMDKWTNSVTGEEYSALLKNLSVEGLCFCCDRKLDAGQVLSLKILIPEIKHSVALVGEVCWSNLIEKAEKAEKANTKFDVGVLLKTINGHPVKESIYFDREYKVEWNEVLDAVFGNYRREMQNRKNMNIK